METLSRRRRRRETPALSHLGPSPWGQREGEGENRENGLFGRGQEHGEDIRPLLPGKKQRHAAAHSAQYMWHNRGVRFQQES